jgi:predicted phosphodiesterase
MPGIPKHDVTPDQLVEAVRETGTFTGAAVRLGIPPGSIQGLMARLGVQEECRRARAARTAPEPGRVVSREEMLEQELAEAREQLARARSDDVREERVIRTLAELLPKARPRYRPAPKPRSSKQKCHSLVLLWSDTHAAEVVSEAETNGANRYDWETMLRRHDELRRGVLSWAERFHPVGELVILGLGDMLSGVIHDELVETNEMPLAEAVVQFAMDGAEWVESFVEDFPRIRFYGVVGNHARARRRPQAKRRYDNADWLVYHGIAQRLSRYESVECEIPKSPRHPVMVCDRRILMLHGDGVRSSMVGVPWGGIVRHAERLRNQYSSIGLPVDHVALGHFHEPNVVSDRRIFVNGSVKGIDEYALEKYGTGAPPSQLLLPFHPDWGLVGAQYIDLGHSG